MNHTPQRTRRKTTKRKRQRRKPLRGRFALLGAAVLLVLLLLLAKRIKSKHGPKGEKPRREKKGKQPETANAPAEELDTPISETDMQ